MSKTISINPDLFKFSSGGGSRKKKSDGQPKLGIKVRAPKDKTKTVRKNHVLRFIRDQQDKNYKKLLEGDKAIKEPEILDESFNTDFDESVKYLMSLAEETDKNARVKNQTLRNYPNRNAPESLLNFGAEPNENVSLVMPDDLQTWSTAEPTMQLTQRPRYPQPSYGCLKNGNLPTYRNYHNKTQRVMPSQRSFAPVSETASSIDNYAPASLPQPNNLSSLMKNEIKQTMDIMNASPVSQNKRMKYPKQQRTIRRTFKLGKSKRYPTVSVLVSNKTLRSQITTKTHLLKQTPIDEVRRFLVKKGFIKVGSSAPNDVLRKMYESASMVCGEIQNHNPDNLLYNFLNGAGINA
jgi:hypothetical protein